MTSNKWFDMDSTGRMEVGTDCRYDTGHDDHRKLGRLASSFKVVTHLEFPSIICQLPDFGYVTSQALPLCLNPGKIYIWEIR